MILNSKRQGTSRPPCTSGDRRRRPVTLHVIDPPHFKKNHGQLWGLQGRGAHGQLWGLPGRGAHGQLWGLPGRGAHGQLQVSLGGGPMVSFGVSLGGGPTVSFRSPWEGGPRSAFVSFQRRKNDWECCRQCMHRPMGSLVPIGNRPGGELRTFIAT